VELLKRIIYINKSYVYLTDEPHYVSSNLDFAVDEFEHSEKTKRDVALLVYRVVSVHPFAQGNKRTANAIMEIYYGVDAELSKRTLKHISENVISLDKEAAIGMLLEIMR
jgi:Fic family protein